MLTNLRDAFIGQSRSPNIFDFQNAVTLKTGLGVRQGHWKYHLSIERIRLPIDVLLSRVVSEIFKVEKCRDLQIGVRSTSSNELSFDRAYMVSY